MHVIINKGIITTQNTIVIHKHHSTIKQKTTNQQQRHYSKFQLTGFL